MECLWECHTQMICHLLQGTQHMKLRHAWELGAERNGVEPVSGPAAAQESKQAEGEKANS